MNFETLTVKQICNCIAVMNKMMDEKIIKFNPNKAGVQLNYDKATRYLENQNVEQQQEIETLQQELQRKDNIINVIKEELSKDFCTYVCKNRTYGKTFKAGAEVYKEHLLYKIKELENSGSDE